MRMLTVYITITEPGVKQDIAGCIDRPLLATEQTDNEENAVRLAEQMVREAFRRLRVRETSGSNL